MFHSSVETLPIAKTSPSPRILERQAMGLNKKFPLEQRSSLHGASLFVSPASTAPREKSSLAGWRAGLLASACVHWLCGFLCVCMLCICALDKIAYGARMVVLHGTLDPIPCTSRKPARFNLTEFVVPRFRGLM